MRPHRVITLPCLLALLAGCIATPTEPPVEPIGEGRRVLFIGNSYRYAQDIPGFVQALADSAGGDRLAVATVAYADAALSDHLLGGAAIPSIRAVAWEWVVLQQGPSSVSVNRDSLRQSAAAFATEIEKTGARPALFSAWPTRAGTTLTVPAPLAQLLQAAALAATTETSASAARR